MSNYKNLSVTIKEDVMRKLEIISRMLTGNLSKTVNDLLEKGLKDEAVKIMMQEKEAQLLIAKSQLLLNESKLSAQV